MVSVASMFGGHDVPIWLAPVGAAVIAGAVVVAMLWL
jgi:hypothetical protein